MKQILYMLCLTLIAYSYISADEQHDIAEIQQLYTKVTQMAKAEGMYHSHIVVNGENNPWRAPGTFAQNIDIYFSDSMKIKDGPLVYIKNASELSAGYRNEEYLFDTNGELVFVFYEDYYHERIKHRIYLENGSPFLYKKGDEVIRDPFDTREFPLQRCIDRGNRLYDFTFNVLMR